MITHKERFRNLFQGKSIDRVPFIDFMGNSNFPSCLERWKKEGLAPDADWETVHSIIGFDYQRGIYIDAKLLFYPEFPIEFIKREGDKTYTKNKWGGLELQKDGSELLPITLEGPVSDRDSWEQVKERLVGQIPNRMPKNLASLSKQAEETGLPVFAGDLPAGFFGALREILGLENLVYMFYDEPELINEIMDTLCDLWIDAYNFMQEHIAIDYIFIWEDMCSKTGPLISPDMFGEFLLPRYKRMINSVRKNEDLLLMVDTDGDGRLLVPLWIEGGVDIVVPWETQFGIDMKDVRKQYPKLGIIGAINKHALEHSRSDMDAELNKVPYMLEKGYYIPSLDHGVTNEVPWDNYQYFYDKLKEIIFKYS